MIAAQPVNLGMAIFDDAFAYAMINEGGALISDHALDAGGVTKWGVSLRALQKFAGADKTATDIRGLTQETAKAFYRQNYWLAPRYDGVANSALAMALFDVGVVAGPAQSTKIMQRIVDVKDDGVLGPKTRAAINTANADTVLTQFSYAVQQLFISIVRAKPDQRVWAYGWLCRAVKLQTLGLK